MRRRPLRGDGAVRSASSQCHCDVLQAHLRRLRHRERAGAHRRDPRSLEGQRAPALVHARRRAARRRSAPSAGRTSSAVAGPSPRRRASGSAHSDSTTTGSPRHTRSSARLPRGRSFPRTACRGTTSARPEMAQRIVPMIAYEDAGAAIDWLTRGVRLHRAHGPRYIWTTGTSSATPSSSSPASSSCSRRRAATTRARSAIARSARRRPLARQPVGRRRRASCRSTTSDAHHDPAVAAGATVIRPLERTRSGFKMYTAEDLEGTAGCSSSDDARRVPPEPRPRSLRRGVRAAALARRRGLAGRDPRDGRLPRASARRHDRASHRDRRVELHIPEDTDGRDRRDRPRRASPRSTVPGSSSATRSSTSGSTART